MISRVAECCFWMLRYIERAENMSRLLRVNRSFLLDISVPDLQRWQPAVVVAGELERFNELHYPNDINDGEIVQEYMTWSEDCQVGILSSAYWARDNARTIRDTISIEMWESINAFWQWLRGGQGRRLYNADRDSFYKRIQDNVAHFSGMSFNTLLRRQPFDFMRLGMLLERAAQTARIMDVKYHLLGPTRPDASETPIESAQWVALLRSCSAEQSYLKKAGALMGSVSVAGFLLLEQRFPRSVYHCIQQSHTYLERIREQSGNAGVHSSKLLEDLEASIRTKSIDEVVQTGLHKELTRIIDATSDICAAIHADYFDPMLPQGQLQTQAQVS